jgi:hypothetical protein
VSEQRRERNDEENGNGDDPACRQSAETGVSSITRAGALNKGEAYAFIQFAAGVSQVITTASIHSTWEGKREEADGASRPRVTHLVMIHRHEHYQHDDQSTDEVVV